MERVTSSLRYYEAPNLFNIAEFNDPTRPAWRKGKAIFRWKKWSASEN